MGKISLVLVGLGGYGGYYMTFIKESVDPELYEMIGVVDPYAEDAPAYEKVKSQNIPIYDSLEEFYIDHTADLVLICTPIPLHKSQTVTALEHGSNVLCEKPIAPLQQDAVFLQKKADECGKLLGVGFQWSYARPMLDFKEDIISGLFGAPKSVKSYVSWKRYDAYYENSGWKGRAKNQNGDWILDSIVTNATSHYLNHLFFLMGERLDESAMPAEVQAEVYRAKEIETFDTCFIRGRFENGCCFYYGATHSAPTEYQPTLECCFENAVVTMSGEQGNHLIARFHDGRVKDYGLTVCQETDAAKIPGMIRAIEGTGILTGTVKSVMPHLKITNAIFDQVEIAEIPAEYRFREEKPGGTFVHGLDEQGLRCFENMHFPSEENVPWAVEPVTLSLDHYTEFLGTRFNGIGEKSSPL